MPVLHVVQIIQECLGFCGVQMILELLLCFHKNLIKILIEIALCLQIILSS